MAEIVVFVDGYYGGYHTHFYNSQPDLSKVPIIGTIDAKDYLGGWDHVISSFRILSGWWLFWDLPNYGQSNNPPPWQLGPGGYPVLDGQNDTPNSDDIWSMQYIGDGPIY
jgi:hypothetical protein